MALSIPNWDARFETAQSRKVASIRWTPLPHSFASTLRMQPPEVAAAMMQIVLLAATMPKRGKFNDGGRDITIDEIAAYVGASSALVAKAMSALGAEARQRRGEEKEEREEKDVLRVAAQPSERSSAGADVVMRIWNENRLKQPEARTMGKDRARLVALMAKDSGLDEALLASSAAAFASDPWNIEHGYGIETWCRNRSRWLDLGRNGHHAANGKSLLDRIFEENP